MRSTQRETPDFALWSSPYWPSLKVTYHFSANSIDRFHMTSRRPYLCTKQWIGGHVCVQKDPVGIELFHMLKLSFIPSNLKSCWSRDWKQMALSIQHKFRCEISEIPSAQWNGTFRLHRPGTQAAARLVIVLGTAGYRRAVLRSTIFSNGKGDFGPTDPKWPDTVREDHLQSWSRIFGWTKPKWSVLFDAPTEISGVLGWMQSDQTQRTNFEEIRSALSQPGPLTRLAHLIW